jgi:hypothetical protein
MSENKAIFFQNRLQRNPDIGSKQNKAMLSMMTFDEIPFEAKDDEDQIRRQVEKSEKDIILQQKMMDKLRVPDIPALEFISADETHKFSDLY